jgi:uncharacterized protein DUF1592/uncharacterized protein DUF1588/uncharacterized protein DUF1587/uncharacterized protein DUF1595/uncharacterized protein DUF1585/cytochrome c
MFGKRRKPFALAVVAVMLATLGGWYVLHPIPEARSHASPPTVDKLENRFASDIRPFVERYCLKCHATNRPKGDLDLSRDTTPAAVVSNLRQWSRVLDRLQANEMPPEDAKRQPSPAERASVIAWLRDLQEREAQKNSGDPGPVLARRLSNAEYDYTIRDLTGVDLRPTRTFPVDPANEAGFDNSGESLTMSPALLKKYLAAARLVAEHMVLQPGGFVFAPHPVLTDTDRDKYCVQRIIDFYDRHKVNFADYFFAAWKHRYGEQLSRPGVDLDRCAAEAGLSSTYLAIVWKSLTEGEAVGPLAVLRKVWRELPGPDRSEAARAGCQRLRDLVVNMRRQLKPKVDKLHVKSISEGSQPLVLWHNRQLAARHRTYSGDVFADLRKLAEQLKAADAAFADLLHIRQADAETERRHRAALERFCAVFPDAFVVTDRGPYFDPKAAGKGRPLTAGFHLMQGYFRDDEPLRELILNEQQRRELEALWFELNFITLAPQRQYKDFIFFERAEPPRFMYDAEFDFARSEDKDATTPAKIERLAKAYLAKARKNGAGGEAETAIASYFTNMITEIRAVERARQAAEPSHLAALTAFAERAYRRPLTPTERDDLLAFYQKLRKENELNHEDALRDTLVTVLLSPHFCYRFDLAERSGQSRSDHELASRLSYFLWSSMPDADLLAHAKAGELHKTEVLTAQTRRMLRDPKVRGLATEFAGNWLDFRRFEEHNSVDRARFPTFTNELRQAMFEEPIRYFLDMVQRNRSVLDLVYGNDTFVNRPLAQHYGMTEVPLSGEWIHVEDASRYQRGGLLPMAVFLTKNAPGLRTSPVKRGYWVVRRLLGEIIPPPPPTVPELPNDEAKLGDLTLPQLLARHRADKNCAACHRRFDSVGLVFENFGPVGEQRSKDLGGHAVQTVATFPDGTERDGLPGLRVYVRDKRQNDFVENLCRKMFSYALGRSLLLSDKKALDDMRARLVADRYAFGSLVESIVTSPQFLNKRGRDDSRK